MKPKVCMLAVWEAFGRFPQARLEGPWWLVEVKNRYGKTDIVLRMFV